MAIERRGSSFRVKLFDGKKLILQRTFHSRCEAAQFEKQEKARLTLSRDDRFQLALNAFTSKLRFVPLPALLASAWAVPKTVETERYRTQPAGTVLSYTPDAFEGRPQPRRPRTAPVLEAPSMRLRELIERFMEEVVPTHRGAAEETSRFKFFLTLPICKKLVGDLTKQDFRDYQVERFKKVSAATIRRETSFWSAMFAHAMEMKWIKIPDNPARVKPLPGSDVERDRRLEGDEEERLLGAADPLMKDLIVILIDVAQRAGATIEITPAMLHDLGTPRARIIMKQVVGGKKRGRAIPLSERAQEVLSRRREGLGDDAILFPISVSNASMRFGNLCRQLKIVDLRMHDLRHEGVSRLFASRLYNQIEIGQISGHRSMQMLARYLTTDGRELAERRSKAA